MNSKQWVSRTVKATKIFEAIINKVGNWEVVYLQYKDREDQWEDLLTIADELQQQMILGKDLLDYLDPRCKKLWEEKLEMFDKVGKELETKVRK